MKFIIEILTRVEYDVKYPDPNYGLGLTPEEMLRIDHNNAEETPEIFMDMEEAVTTVTSTLIKKGNGG